MLVLKTSMSREGTLATNIFNELERSQVLESNVLMAKQQCKNQGLEVFRKSKKEEDL